MTTTTGVRAPRFQDDPKGKAWPVFLAQQKRTQIHKIAEYLGQLNVGISIDLLKPDPESGSDYYVIEIRGDKYYEKMINDNVAERIKNFMERIQSVPYLKDKFAYEPKPKLN